MPQPLKNQYRDARARWKLLTLYQKFEHAVILVLTLLISIVVALAVWNLALKILLSIVASRGFDLRVEERECGAREERALRAR